MDRYSSMSTRTLMTTLLLTGALSSCGGGSSSDTDSSNATGQNLEVSNSLVEPNDETTNDIVVDETGFNADVLTGVFVDSAVEGVSYATDTQAGITNSAGEFLYKIGEEVSFSIGSIEFPPVLGAVQVSPVDMGLVSSDPRQTTVNIARLLQSLDDDGDPENGIDIPESAVTSSVAIDFFQDSEAFSNDTNVINLVANSSSQTNTLVDEGTAVSHLESQVGPLPGENLSTENLTSETTELQNTGLQVNRIEFDTRLFTAEMLVVDGRVSEVRAGPERGDTTGALEGCGANDMLFLAKADTGFMLSDGQFTDIVVPAGTCVQGSIEGGELANPLNIPESQIMWSIETITGDFTSPEGVDFQFDFYEGNSWTFDEDRRIVSVRYDQEFLIGDEVVLPDGGPYPLSVNAGWSITSSICFPSSASVVLCENPFR